MTRHREDDLGIVLRILIIFAVVVLAIAASYLGGYR